MTAALMACGSSGGDTRDSAANSQGGTGSPPGGRAQGAPTVAAEDVKTDYVGRFSVSPDRGPIGTAVTARGSGFTPSASLDLVWQGFTGRWNVDYDKYLGRQYAEVIQPLTKVQTDASGAFEARITVPEGFGFNHDVRLIQDSVIRNKATFYVEMQVTISPTSGPVGTPITIEAKGIGWMPLESNWDLLYDNRFTGFISAVSTNGYAKVVIPATGGPGKHIINILHGSFTFPYMNMQQSPSPDRPTWVFEFNLVKGQAVQPPQVEKQGLPRELAIVAAGLTGPQLLADWKNGEVGTPVTLRGQGFTANDSVELLWFRVTGNRVGGQGWDENSSTLGTRPVGPDGTFVLPFQTPDELGGDHRIEARVKGDKVTQTTYVITPSASTLSTSSGPVGTTMTLHVKGAGWTETANIYTVVYDNAYIGYSCAFNSQGDIEVFLPATGEAGWHYIDLYPAIYKGKDITGVETFRIPQLAFAADHPGEKLPAFHFAFQVTD
jgi:hypothetical protein